MSPMNSLAIASSTTPKPLVSETSERETGDQRLGLDDLLAYGLAGFVSFDPMLGG